MKGRGQDALAMVDLECKQPTELTASVLFIFPCSGYKVIKNEK